MIEGTRALDLLIRAERVVVGGREEPRAIGVRDGVIAVLLPFGTGSSAAEEITIGAEILPSFTVRSRSFSPRWLRT